ncbi:O-antigen ligase family protein [Pontimicrobium sp. IMCC45349]|uniref:O-antigen ligase family protein n=1 Tax=Pontimicrobium sp. IMCC45349 TaxID=3391574 RepID=UPI00399F5631
MNLKENYIALVIMHIVIGVLIYSIGSFSRIFFLAVIGYFLVQIIISPIKQKTYNILLACAYIVGSEVLFRMTGGGIFYESSKYFVIFFALFGMFYRGISGKGYPYFIYLILLVPAVVVASTNLGYDLNFRKSVAFVLSGPVCLGVAALFFYDKKIHIEKMLNVLVYLSLPVVSMTTYLFLYTPSLKSVLTGTGSNFAASGGFGPNQVSTMLGIGMFAFTVRFFMKSPTLFLKVFNAAVLGAIAFRAIVTFSRGGVLAAIIMIGAFLWLLYAKSSYRQKQNILLTFVLFCFVGIATWITSSNQTEGLIDKRYSNQDAKGEVKEDISTGRVDLFVGELEGFFQHPFVGVGASGMKQFRLELEGGIVASHNEISRLLSEHGLMGVLILLILIFKPLDYRTQHKGNLFFYAFLCFWFATINHSAMRIAAPAFIYSLSLLNIRYDKPSIRRKQLKA